MTALRTLIKAVERGFGRPTNWRDFAELEQPFRAEGEESRAILAHRAYHGSVDAALALMQAVLPGWTWEGGTLSQSATVYTPDYPGEDFEALSCSAQADTPARALLLAILKAVEAQTASARKE